MKYYQTKLIGMVALIDDYTKRFTTLSDQGIMLEMMDLTVMARESQISNSTDYKPESAIYAMLGLISDAENRRQEEMATAETGRPRGYTGPTRATPEQMEIENSIKFWRTMVIGLVAAGYREESRDERLFKEIRTGSEWDATRAGDQLLDTMHYYFCRHVNGALSEAISDELKYANKTALTDGQWVALKKLAGTILQHLKPKDKMETDEVTALHRNLQLVLQLRQEKLPLSVTVTQEQPTPTTPAQ